MNSHKAAISGSVGGGKSMGPGGGNGSGIKSAAVSGGYGGQ